MTAVTFLPDIGTLIKAIPYQITYGNVTIIGGGAIGLVLITLVLGNNNSIEIDLSLTILFIICIINNKNKYFLKSLFIKRI